MYVNKVEWTLVSTLNLDKHTFLNVEAFQLCITGEVTKKTLMLDNVFILPFCQERTCTILYTVECNAVLLQCGVRIMA